MLKINDKKEYNRINICVGIIKIVLAVFLASNTNIIEIFDLTNNLFNSIAAHDITSLYSSYDLQTPYPFLLVLIYSIVYLPIKFLSIENIVIIKILYFLPVLVSDYIINKILYMLFPKKTKEILIFFTLNPVLIYLSYINGSVDFIGLCFLFYAILFLFNRKYKFSCLFLALGFCIKIPVVFSLPLIAIYMFRTEQKEIRIIRPLKYSLTFVVCSFVLSLPFILIKDYWDNILLNESQGALFSSVLKIGSSQIFVAISALIFIYLHYLIGHTNKVVLFNYATLVYGSFVFLIEPEASWFLWVTLFFSITFIVDNINEKISIIAIYIMFSVTSILYFSNILPEFTLFNVLSQNILITFSLSFLAFIIYYQCRYSLKKNRRSAAQYITIGLTGDSASGKSTFKNAIIDLLGTENTLEIESDGYHKWERKDENWNKYTHLNPFGNLLHKQAEQINSLKKGESVKFTEYNHSTGKFSDTFQIDSKNFILVAGLHTFYLESMRKAIDIKIYMDIDEKLRRHWKLIRDCQNRGHASDAVIKSMDERMPDAEKYIYPQRDFADLIFEHYVNNEYTIGDLNAEIDLKLRVKIPIDLFFDEIYENLVNNGEKINFYYSSDVSYSVIEFFEPISKESTEKIIANYSNSSNDIINSMNLDIKEGYAGCMQLILFLYIDYLLKEQEHNEY